MVKRFETKNLFDSSQITNMVQNFGLKRQDTADIQLALQQAFGDYVLAALSEISGSPDEHRQLYLEASFHLQKAARLLNGLPHPAGKMANRLDTMETTLQKLVEGKIGSAAERANRFMEKNLVRKLREIWRNNTPNPFHAGGDDSGKNPRDFIVYCFHVVGQAYPEIEWFGKLNRIEADMLIKAIKR